MPLEQNNTFPFFSTGTQWSASSVHACVPGPHGWGCVSAEMIILKTVQLLIHHTAPEGCKAIACRGHQTLYGSSQTRVLYIRHIEVSKYVWIKAIENRKKLHHDPHREQWEIPCLSPLPRHEPFKWKSFQTAESSMAAILKISLVPFRYLSTERMKLISSLLSDWRYDFDTNNTNYGDIHSILYDPILIFIPHIEVFFCALYQKIVKLWLI